MVKPIATHAPSCKLLQVPIHRLERSSQFLPQPERSQQVERLLAVGGSNEPKLQNRRGVQNPTQLLVGKQHRIPFVRRPDASRSRVADVKLRERAFPGQTFRSEPCHSPWRDTLRCRHPEEYRQADRSYWN